MKLGSLFSDGAVLQRDKWLPIWGESNPNDTIKAELAGSVTYTFASGSGDFLLRLPPMPAGGPYELTVTDQSTGETVKVKDVYIGEVWLGSGQSNMSYRLNARDTAEFAENCTGKLQRKEFGETAKTSAVPLRCFNVKQLASWRREKYANAKWVDASDEKFPDIPAVAGWFGLELREKLNIPVGIIVSAWGGTIIETWSSRSALLMNPDAATLVTDQDKCCCKEYSWWRPDPSATRDTDENIPDPGNTAFAKGWAETDFDDSEWADMEVPGSWIAQRIAGNGVLWARCTVDIPAEYAGKDMTVHFGGVDKTDITYFNGVEIGSCGEGFSTAHWNMPRSYPVPGKLIKAGKNVIAVRAFSFAFDGSFNGSPKRFFLSCDECDKTFPLNGIWKAKSEHEFGLINSSASIRSPGSPNWPSVLFDSMIRPLLPAAIRGVIWYQGESNTRTMDDSLSYCRKMQLLINDWSYHFEQPKLPFIQVLLANYTQPEAIAPGSLWSLIRESQINVCSQLPNADIASAIDLGEANDIHPQDKKSVGKRLALVALNRVYGTGDVFSGPRFKTAEVCGSSLRITFDFAEGMKLTDDAGKSIFIAGADREFHPVDDAVVSGGTLTVSSAKVSAPCAVRYAWSKNPSSVIYNAAGLPAYPFRSDSWEFDPEA